MSVRASDYFRGLDLLVFTDGYESKTAVMRKRTKTM